ncbi:MAG: hypothetical protein RIS36_2074 [Pseudomonadota bacterium]|jgi:hypothetical protein
MSKISQVLFEALQRRYPHVEVSPRARFLPMLDLSKGEMSSTAAIEVARTLRGDALAIAGDLVLDLEQHVPEGWSVVAGYIILTHTPNDILREEAKLGEEVFNASVAGFGQRTIICLVPDSTTPVYARLRLIACSAMQALLAVAFEGGCRLGFEPEAPRFVSTQDEVIDLVQDAVVRCFQNESESRFVFGVPHEFLSREAPVVVWSAHHYHDRLSREVKQWFVETRNAGTCILKIPSDGWLLSRERALAELLSLSALKKVVRHLTGREAWLRWIHHLASSIPSGDLDPAVALYDECASPRWSLQVLHQRVCQLVLPHTIKSQPHLRDCILSLPLRERGLLLSSLFLPALTARAVREGEVLAWSTVAESFAAQAHGLLNAPHYRVALQKGDFSPEVMQINAGLVLGVVGILSAITEG